MASRAEIQQQRAAFNSLEARRQRLQDWQALCTWLEDQPYNASYRPKGQGAYLLGKGRPGYSKLLKAERLRMPVFWSTGHGWRLNTGWAEVLDAEERAIADAEREADAADAPRLRGERDAALAEIERLRTAITAYNNAAFAALRLLEEQLQPSEPDEEPDPDISRVFEMLAVVTGYYDGEPDREDKDYQPF